MIIGLCGAICAGKTSVADYLIEKHNFISISIARPKSKSFPDDGDAPVDRSITGDMAPQLEFPDVKTLDDHMSHSWQENCVLTTIWDESVLETLLKRPFFIFVSVDAPIGVRWRRFRERCEQEQQKVPALEDFVLRNDQHLYNSNASLAALSARARIKILNSGNDIKSLWSSLDSLNLLDESRLRPTWDQYFMQLADLAARRSNCMRRIVGCVLVRENRVISTGYNGTPRGVTNCNQGGCPRCNTTQGRGMGLSTCLCLHAEENALLEAGRERIGDAAVLYCNTCPCLTCSVKIVQVGIKEVVFSQSYHMDAESAKIFQVAGVRLRQFSPPREGLVNLCSLT
ncbi:hypothetical protein MBLNU459_g4515t1 [Dothideomycetes sp. NU459]